MGTRVVLAGLGVLLISGLAFWMLVGERDSRSVPEQPREAPRARGERPEVPLESAESVAPETIDRERVVTPTPASEDTFLPPGVQAPADWPGTCSLFGRLLDEKGRAVSGPTVWLTDANGTRQDAELEGGRYRARGLAPGRWWIESRGGAFLDVRESVELFRSDEALEVDLIFHSKLLADVGVYSSSGGTFWEGLSEAELLFGVELRVLATREAGRSAEELEKSNLARFRAAERKGRQLSDPLLGTLEIAAEPPLVVSLLLGMQVLGVQTLEPGMTELTFVVDPRAVIDLLVTLRFRVLDTTGAPTDQASVMIEGGGESSINRLLTDGVFERDGLYPGSCQVTIQSAGHNMIRRTVALQPPLVDLGDLRLEPASSLHGLVVDPKGVAVTSAADGGQRDDVYLEFGRLDSTTGEFVIDSNLLFALEESGEFRLPLEAGTYLIRAFGEKWISANTVVTVPGDAVTLTVFPPSVVVLKLDGGDWNGWTFTLLDGEGLLVDTGQLEGSAPRRLDLAPGSYALTLTDTEGLPRQQVPFELGQEELVINLTL